MRKLTALILSALAFAGCDNTDPKAIALDAAEKRVKVGAFSEAIKNYEDALDGTKETADLHYKIAVLYDDKLKRPLDAIHHYDRYLALLPNGSHAKESKTAKDDCEVRLQATMTKGGFMTTTEAVRLRNESEALRKINAGLQSEIAALKKLVDPKLLKAAQPTRVPQPGAEDKMPPGSKMHTVAKGETLAAIARKYYDSTAMSSFIKDANFNQLEGKDVIRPGQVLIIPERPKRPRQ